MKQLLLAGAAVLGLIASGLVARATPITLDYTGSLVDFTVPATGAYQVLAFGAQGGDGGDPVFGPTVGPGGLGAEIGGDFTFTAGEVLQIAVGGAGVTVGDGGGGGGGTFVVANGVPLVIAGGGGGGGVSFQLPIPGGGGLTGLNGGGFDGGIDGNGGGSPGIPGISSGGGGGFFSGGVGVGTPGNGGGGFPGLLGGTPGGGFGGGGGSGFNASGGGGGYSGGGGSEGGGLASVDIGGGGGSFDVGTDQILVAGFQTGNGEVVITELVPEPASLALLGSALIGLAVVWRRRRPGTFGLRRG